MPLFFDFDSLRERACAAAKRIRKKNSYDKPIIPQVNNLSGCAKFEDILDGNSFFDFFLEYLNLADVKFVKHFLFLKS